MITNFTWLICENKNNCKNQLWFWFIFYPNQVYFPLYKWNNYKLSKSVTFNMGKSDVVKRCFFMINDSNECVVNKKKSTHKLYKLYTNLQCIEDEKKKILLLVKRTIEFRWTFAIKWMMYEHAIKYVSVCILSNCIFTIHFC